MTEFWVFDAARWPAGSGSAAALAAFLWGVGSALLSPCHLGVIPLMGSHAAGIGPFGSTEGRGAGSSAQAVGQVAAFTLGYFAVIPLLTLVLLLVGETLGHAGHYWTVPVGGVLLWFGYDMLRSHACSGATHLLEPIAKRLRLGPFPGAVALGFAYGAISAACTAGFLMPLILAVLPQGLATGLGMGAAFGLGHSLPMLLVGCSAYFAARFYHSHPHEPEHSHEPHRAERLFRRVMGGVIMLVGVLFIAHPFLEH